MSGLVTCKRAADAWHINAGELSDINNTTVHETTNDLRILSPQ